MNSQIQRIRSIASALPVFPILTTRLDLERSGTGSRQPDDAPIGPNPPQSMSSIFFLIIDPVYLGLPRGYL